MTRQFKLANLLELIGAAGLGEFRVEWAHISRFLRPQPVATVEEPRSALVFTPAAGGKKVAHVGLFGMLSKASSSWFYGTSTVQVRRDLNVAANDSDVAGIMLNIDSPGGYVSGTDDLAQDIRSIRKSKPVWAAIDDLGASAAYWVASQADRITANSPTAMIGSIGTFQTIPDVSAAMAGAGIKVHLIATGPLKGLGAFGTKVSDDQLSHVQGLVDAVQEIFDAAVMKGRGLNAKQLDGVRHGGVMPARVAQQKGLIDAVQPRERTLSEFAAAIKGGTAANYQKSLALLSSGQFEINADGDLVATAPTPPASKSQPTGSLPMLKLAGLPVLSASETSQ